MDKNHGNNHDGCLQECGCADLYAEYEKYRGYDFADNDAVGEDGWYSCSFKHRADEAVTTGDFVDAVKEQEPAGGETEQQFAGVGHDWHVVEIDPAPA